MLYKESQSITKAKQFVNGSAQLDINKICLGQSQKKINIEKGQNILWMKRDASYFLKQPRTQTHKMSDVPKY